jgi:2-polyprenyl-3-methyl-5-hydroxy-6-metoxy-1,4-benzoquinol methylase
MLVNESGGMSMKQSEYVYLIADISGYTSFVVAHQKAVAHSQMIVAQLLQTLVDEAKESVELSRLEGDAVFFYLDKGGLSADEIREATGTFVRRAFRAFAGAAKALAKESICKCPACDGIGNLQLKMVVHSGTGVVSEIGGSKEFAGVDVIIVHRLLKNSVDRDDYLLLTDAAKADVALPNDYVLAGSEETYDEIGTIATWVGETEPLLDVELRKDPTQRASRLAYEILRHEIRKEYAEVATDPDKGFHFNTGRVIAERLGYSEEDMSSVPASALKSFAGTGNPFSVGEIPEGANVVDIGSGAGFDSFNAARRVGPNGRVIGVDMTPEMLARAQEGKEAGGYDNVEFRAGLAEDLPVPDEWADVVISNGVINLCPNKPVAFAEIFRVLKPGGRLQIGDILVEKQISESARRNVDLWTA